MMIVILTGLDFTLFFFFPSFFRVLPFFIYASLPRVLPQTEIMAKTSDAFIANETRQDEVK